MLLKNDLLCFVYDIMVISVDILMRVSHDIGWFFATRILVREAKWSGSTSLLVTLYDKSRLEFENY